MLPRLSAHTLPLVLLLFAFAASSAIAAGRSSAVTIGQSNPGTLDINRTIDPQLVARPGAQSTAVTTAPLTTSTSTTSPLTTSPIISSPMTTSVGAQAPTATGAVATPLQPNTGANGLPLTATTSGATTTGIGIKAVLGATGRDMNECMGAWDRKTHITKARWREICKSTLTD
jgi:hypothetical protein